MLFKPDRLIFYEDQDAHYPEVKRIDKMLDNGEAGFRRINFNLELDTLYDIISNSNEEGNEKKVDIIYTKESMMSGDLARKLFDSRFDSDEECFSKLNKFQQSVILNLVSAMEREGINTWKLKNGQIYSLIFSKNPPKAEIKVFDKNGKLDKKIDLLNDETLKELVNRVRFVLDDQKKMLLDYAISQGSIINIMAILQGDNPENMATIKGRQEFLRKNNDVRGKVNRLLSQNGQPTIKDDASNYDGNLDQNIAFVGAIERLKGRLLGREIVGHQVGMNGVGEFDEKLESTGFVFNRESKKWEIAGTRICQSGTDFYYMFKAQSPTQIKVSNNGEPPILYKWDSEKRGYFAKDKQLFFKYSINGHPVKYEIEVIGESEFTQTKEDFYSPDNDNTNYKSVEDILSEFRIKESVSSESDHIIELSNKEAVFTVKSIIEKDKNFEKYNLKLKTNAEKEKLLLEFANKIVDSMQHADIKKTEENICFLLTLSQMETGFRGDIRSGKVIWEQAKKKYGNFFDIIARSILTGVLDEKWNLYSLQLQKCQNEKELYEWAQKLADDFEDIENPVSIGYAVKKSTISQSIIKQGLDKYGKTVNTGQEALEEVVKLLRQKPGTLGMFQINVDISIRYAEQDIKNIENHPQFKKFVKNGKIDRDLLVRSVFKHDDSDVTLFPQSVAEGFLMKYYLGNIIEANDFNKDKNVDSNEFKYAIADYHAGIYASRNAAVQAALNKKLRKNLVIDGDLSFYNENGEPDISRESNTMKALLEFSEKLTGEQRSGMSALECVKSFVTEGKNKNLENHLLWKHLIGSATIRTIPLGATTDNSDAYLNNFKISNAKDYVARAEKFFNRFNRRLENKINIGEKLTIEETKKLNMIAQNIRSYMDKRSKEGIPASTVRLEDVLTQLKGQDIALVEAILRVNYAKFGWSKDLEVKINDNIIINEKIFPRMSFSPEGRYLPEHVEFAYERLINAAREDGIDLSAISGYRSEGYQLLLLLEQIVKEKGNIRKAVTAVAPVGFSEHADPYFTAVDFGLSSNQSIRNQQIAWLQANAQKFNFKQSYLGEKESHVINEPWHWRYIGPAIGENFVASRK